MKDQLRSTRHKNGLNADKTKKTKDEGNCQCASIRPIFLLQFQTQAQIEIASLAPERKHKEKLLHRGKAALCKNQR